MGLCPRAGREIAPARHGLSLPLGSATSFGSDHRKESWIGRRGRKVDGVGTDLASGARSSPSASGFPRLTSVPVTPVFRATEMGDGFPAPVSVHVPTDPFYRCGYGFKRSDSATLRAASRFFASPCSEQRMMRTRRSPSTFFSRAKSTTRSTGLPWKVAV
jgi:hypothetical protein